MTDALPDPKKELRRTMRRRLASLAPRDRHEASVAACKRLSSLDEVTQASVVMLYMPLASEVDVIPAAVACFRGGQTVCVPKVDWDRRDMAPVEVRSFDDHSMQTDARSLRTPKDARPVLPETIDVVVVPGLAFDVSGRRLGRGGGYYDRFLGRLRRGAVAIGLAFDCQIVDGVPVEPHDRAVQFVVTERRLTKKRPSQSRP